MEDNEEKQEDTNKLGIGKVFLMEIQQLLRNANTSATYGEYNNWRSNLDCIFRKFSGRLTPNEDAIATSAIEEIDLLGSQHTIRLIKDANRNKGPHKKTIRVGKELTTSLSKYEMIIIKILDRLNWLIPEKKKPKRPQ